MVVEVRCPAKVNLFLSVGQLDERGYHPIRTIFQAIGLFDDLNVTWGTAESEIVCKGFDLPNQNTLSKTLQLASEIVRLPNAKIVLTKRIPTEAGLGGGSSDAAGLLRAIDRLAHGSITESDMLAIAATVGADVPFFLVGGRAKGEGYGERLTPLPDPPTAWACVAMPKVGVSTKDAYAKLDLIPRTFEEFPEGDRAHNEFERVAPCESLDLIEALMMNGANSANLCGSGSAVFGLFDLQEIAEQASAALAGFGVQTWVAKTLTREESLWTS